MVKSPNKTVPILLVTLSEKSYSFYNLDKDTWLNNTVAELKKYTDRKIIVREKGLRPDRIKENSVAVLNVQEIKYML